MQLRPPLLFTLLLAVTACGSSQPPAPPSAPVQPGGGEASASVGDVSVHASVVQTSALPETIARRYGIDRDANTILLLLAVRSGANAEAAAEPIQVNASVTDLRGSRQDIAMRAMEVGGLTDYIGTIQTTLPDTLRFDVHVVRGNGASATMQLSRDFYPQ